MNKISTLLTLFLLSVFAFSISAQSLDDLIKDGDEFYKKFDNQKALEVFQKADKSYPNNAEILWRLSRTLVDIGEHMPNTNSKEEDAQISTYQKSLEFADKAVSLAPDQSITYLRRAIANGRIALFKGVFSVAGVVNSVKADLEKAIQLNNGGNEVQSVAHYVLARTHAKTSEKWKPARSVLGLGWADNEIAIQEYKKAITLKPNYVMFYVDYANSLIREDEYKTAREMLNAALKSPIQDEDDQVRQQEAKKLLNDIKDE